MYMTHTLQKEDGVKAMSTCSLAAPLVLTDILITATYSAEARVLYRVLQVNGIVILDW